MSGENLGQGPEMDNLIEKESALQTPQDRGEKYLSQAEKDIREDAGRWSRETTQQLMPIFLTLGAFSSSLSSYGLFANREDLVLIGTGAAMLDMLLIASPVIVSEVVDFIEKHLGKNKEKMIEAS